MKVSKHSPTNWSSLYKLYVHEVKNKQHGLKQPLDMKINKIRMAKIRSPSV